MKSAAGVRWRGLQTREGERVGIAGEHATATGETGRWRWWTRLEVDATTWQVYTHAVRLAVLAAEDKHVCTASWG